MKYRKFGSTGFEVSALGLGCMRLPTVRFMPQKVDTKKSYRLIRSAVDWALQYLWNLPEVSVVLSGMSSQIQLDENVVSAGRSGIASLSEEDNKVIRELVEIYRRNILVPCTACQYCMNCPSGVNIPQNFAIINNLALEKSFLMRFKTRRSYKKLVGDPAKLNSEKTNGKAGICTECGICIQKCPQGINIPEELKKVDLVMNQGQKIEELAQENQNFFRIQSSNKGSARV